ncbi:MAG: hypothetical protein COV29_01360 [Candidatus Yanofskybacteria bacterium CG10_big_fil_rev_8_21_14_0_10_36_16]|uniref:Septum formation initiator n=1 Tax=Candidatus Yanofskybacteria bacterium CG10_big_fil_rev_8_21_14_0_10_36_16 TaxID=1975096 RepID=A0A2J0Q887_9BACT|nr:MAG: hypothetical protein COV29_01360 [Candidatus Yanofskybacteria bacterium CG10_big_fil_rev_8_21_14_0_10_36_16]
MNNKLFQSPLLTVPLVLLVGFLAIRLIQINPQRVDLNRKISNLENQLKETEELIQELEENAGYYQSDTYKEMQARLKFDLIKPGEKVIYIYENSSDVEASSSAEPEHKKEKSFFGKLFEYVTGD